MTLASDRSFRAGLVQLRSGRSVAPNMEMAEALIRRAAKGGAVYVQTPENTAIMELETERLLSELEVEDKAAPLERLQALAKELGIFLHVGSLGMKLPSGKVANRSYLIAPDGTIAARYDKLHLFDVDLAGGESYREFRTFDPGATAVLADLPWGRLGMSICYDLRFPRSTGRSPRPAPTLSPSPPPSPSRPARRIGMCSARPRHRDRRLRPCRRPRWVARERPQPPTATADRLALG